MKIDPLTCPHAQYREDMKIWCRKAGTWCGHVYFKRCKGWWAMTPAAAQCPIRRDQHERDQDG